MSCYGCLTKFSFFTKEQACPNCKYSFCSKCLKLKAKVNEEEKNVCKNCHKKLTTTSDTMASPDMDTPGLLLKRLETLENPAKPPITIFRQSARLANLKYGLSSEDKKILERLEKLKADHKSSNLPDESEIKRRLALLQDRSEGSTSDKPQKLESPHKSHQEQVEDLLKQYMDEANIQTDVETLGRQGVEDIENRLKKLHTSGLEPATTNQPNQEDEDEDAITAKIVKRAIAEGQLERKLGVSMDMDDDSISDLDENEPEKEEFPWCIICNEDAVVRCFGCDRSLYCNKCFKQGHEFFDMEDHKYVPFTKKNSLSDD